MWQVGRLGTAATMLCLALFGAFAAPTTASSEGPQVLGESVSGVTETSATLEATIDPGDGGAYYQFQLGAERQELAPEMLCPSFLNGDPPCEGEQADGAFPIGRIEGEARAVKLSLGDLAAFIPGATLEPGTKYVFRVVVARSVPREDGVIQWEEPSVVGVGHWFTTPESTESDVGPLVEGPVSTASVPLIKCKKGATMNAGRCDCQGYPPRVVNGKVRCVRHKHLPNFRLLRHPVGLSHLPRSLQYGLAQWLPPIAPPVEARPRVLRGGTVYLGEVGVYGVGSMETVCMRAWGGSEPEHSPKADSVCVSMSDAVKRGVVAVSACTGASRAVRITGLVPNYVTGLGVDRYASGEIEEVIPVKNNAFVIHLEPVGVVLHGLGLRAENFKMKLPLRRWLPGLGCVK